MNRSLPFSRALSEPKIAARNRTQTFPPNPWLTLLFLPTIPSDGWECCFEYSQDMRSQVVSGDLSVGEGRIPVFTALYPESWEVQPSLWDQKHERCVLLVFMSLSGELCLCRTGRRRSGWAPAVLLIGSLDRILWFTVRGELFWKFLSSRCFLHHFASPCKKKPESQQYFFTRQLPGLARATYWTHPPPIAVDTSFCVPFNQLITISHNPLPPLRCLHYPHYRYYRYVLFKGTFLSILCDLD